MNIYFKEDFTAAHWRDWEHCCSVRVAGCFSSPNLVLKIRKSLWCLVHIGKQRKLGFDVHSSGSSRKDYMHKQGLKEQRTKLILLFLQPFVYPGCHSKELTTFSKGLTLSQILPGNMLTDSPTGMSPSWLYIQSSRQENWLSQVHLM